MSVGYLEETFDSYDDSKVCGLFGSGTKTAESSVLFIYMRLCFMHRQQYAKAILRLSRMWKADEEE